MGQKSETMLRGCAVPCRAAGIRCAELGFWGFSKSLVSRIGWNPSSGNMKLGRGPGLFH